MDISQTGSCPNLPLTGRACERKAIFHLSPSIEVPRLDPVSTDRCSGEEVASALCCAAVIHSTSQQKGDWIHLPTSLMRFRPPPPDLRGDDPAMSLMTKRCDDGLPDDINRTPICYVEDQRQPKESFQQPQYWCRLAFLSP